MSKVRVVLELSKCNNTISYSFTEEVKYSEDDYYTCVASNTYSGERLVSFDIIKKVSEFKDLIETFCMKEGIG